MKFYTLFITKKIAGSMVVKSIFKINFNNYLQDFNTKDTEHPGFKMLLEKGEYFIGGTIKSFFVNKNKYTSIASSPEKTKKIKRLGLKKIAAFQTRNVPHNDHEFILDLDGEKVGALFIQPLIGKKKKGDFHPDAIINSYRYLLNYHFPRNKVILGVLTTNMRYAGPREALFQTIIRKIMGAHIFWLEETMLV